MVYDTLKITAAIVPVTIAVSPAARSASVQQGTAAPSDNATVTLSGTNAASTAWSATKKKAWLTLTTASGTGSGTVAWSRNATGLAVGTYVDTITVTAASASAVVYDTLKITAAAVQIALDVNPLARKASVVQGGAAPGDNMTVTLSGSGAGAVTWWAVKRQPWLTFTNAGGTGGGSIAWTRHATGLAVGTYVDTITVSSGSTASVTVYDTLAVLAAPVPVVVALSPVSRNVAVPEGGAGPSDNASVTLAGTGAASTNWVATNRKSWSTITSASGTGNGTVAWSRSANGLSAGIHVDTITVAAGSATAAIVDTLRITAITIPIVMSVSPTGRTVSVRQGSTAPGDNAQVSITGTNAQGAIWTATHANSAWFNFLNAGGTGDGLVTWNRNVATLAAGTYVDTITVTIAGSGQAVRVYDSVLVTPIAPTHRTIAINPRGRRVRSVALTGSSLVAPSVDSAMVESSGADSGNGGAWTAAVGSSRLALITSSGAANTYVRWTRVAQTLNPGLYVDTVVVSLQGDAGVRAEFVDSLEVVAVAVPVPDLAVGDLFDHLSLTDDQRVALDRQGNNNGGYDLGDFLAWVSRNHIRLSAATSVRLNQLRAGKVGAP